MQTEQRQLNTEKLIGKAGALVCTNGEAEIDINGTKFKIQKGDICVVSPILMYPESFTCSYDFEMESLLEKIEMLFPNVQKFFNTGFFVTLMQDPTIQLRQEDFEMVQQRIKDIERLGNLSESSVSDIFQQMIYQSSLTLITSTLIELIAKYVTTRVIDTNVRKDFNILSKFFLKVLSSKVIVRNVSYYADYLNLSTGYFSAIVRKNLGKSPQAWIEFFIINRAKMLLRKPQMSVKEVSDALGFPEQFTFRKYFKTHTGMSPSEFRQK